MIKTITVVLMFLLSIYLIHSDEAENKEEAKVILQEAITIMDNGEYENSLELLKEAEKLDPDNMTYSFEMGYAFYLMNDYKKAIDKFRISTKHMNANAQCYQMLGNAYDMDEQPEKAIQTYKMGLQKYPNSGRLYFELGNMEPDDIKALDVHEKGIEVDPIYPSNYYQVCSIFSITTEPIWAVLYGELFMNIERGSSRTEKMSRMLYELYHNSIQFTSDSTFTISFSKNVLTNLASFDKDFKLPFSIGAYEPTIALSVINENEITIESLCRIRKNFINFYYNKKLNEIYPNILFDWHKNLIENDYFESYNYWLLMKGNPEEFELWYSKNSEIFDQFINWFSSNPLIIDESNKFARSQYD